MSVCVRATTGEDADLLACIHAEGFDAPWDAASFQSFLARDICFALLATPASMPAQAFILIQIVGDSCEILSLATLRAARRNGLGRLLLRAGAQEAAARGGREMFLEVATDNGPAQALYRSSGFVEKGRRPGYYRAGGGRLVDALILRAELPLSA